MHISQENKNMFYDLLNDDDGCNTDVYNINNTNPCLISKQPLTYNYVTLPCGHKFNYIPLLKEVITQKTTRNPLNITFLNINQIQCPYCRTVHNKLLPFIPTSLYSKRIRGVTAPAIYCIAAKTCSWKFKSGKRKGEICGKEAYENGDGCFCTSHHKCNKNTEVFLSWNEEMEDLKKLTIAQLKDILHKEKLKKTGNKTTLIQRIVTYKKVDTT